MKNWTLWVATFLCLGTAVHNSKAKELTLDDIFPSDRVIDVQITVSQRDWDTIRYQSRNFFEALNEGRQFTPPEHPYTYVEASVSIDGVMFPKVGIRKKGFIGSQSNTRPSLKIKLNHIDKQADIEGLKNLTLNNNLQDVAQLSQFMGYALFNAAGSPAPRCAYAKVTLNGKNLGIYSHVETLRKPLLKRAFGNNNGPLYEGTVVDFHSEWENGFEHKRGNDTKGREKILTLINTLANDKVTEEAIGELVDLESFYRFWAIEGLLGFWDGYSGNNNNFFIYLNPDTNKFHFIPWGADSLFMKFGWLDFQRTPGAPFSVKTQGLIAHKLYQLESGRERYKQTMMDLLENHWNEISLLAEVDRISEMIAPHLSHEQRVIKSEEWEQRETKKTVGSGQEAVREFIRTRRGEILQEIADGMPIWRRTPHPPFVINPETFDKEQFELPEEGLAHAARTGDLSAIREYIAGGEDVNAPDEKLNLSPLAWSAIYGESDATRLLIKSGADVNARTEDGDTALHGAAFFGRSEVVKLLIENGADIQARNDKGQTLADGLSVDVRTTTFIANLVGIDIKKEGFTNIQEGRKEVGKLLGVDEKHFEKSVSAAQSVWEAVFIGDTKMLEQALTEGVDINAVEPESGVTLLMTAAVRGHTKAVAMLLEHGADINVKNRDGSTALHAAAFLGRAETVQLLLEKGADASIRSNDGTTPLGTTQADWQLTQFIAGLLQIEVDEAEINIGRSEVVKLLSQHNRK